MFFRKCSSPSRLAALAIAAAILGCMAAPSHARTNHALLIGAQAYPGLDKGLQLGGPGNDAALVSAFLTSNPAAPFAPGNVTVLSDGIDGATLPTLANIRAAFAELTGKIAPGDFVYLHFAGHGSRAPTSDPANETDGLDELFLPSDVGKWDSYIGSVENALVDDEIGRLIDGLRAKDAVVWAVFDSCHSGTVTRGAPTGGEEVRMRKIEPAALGIPEDVLDDAEAIATRGKKAGAQPKMVDVSSSGKGSLVAFYAAQSTETTPEMRLPAGKKGRQSHGLFTWTIFEVLAEYPGITYRQLGQEVLRRYSAKYMASPTPLFDGDLDRVVFDVGKADAIRQWPISLAEGTATIAAGELHQLSEGDLLAVLDRPTAKTEDAIGFLKVETITPLSATLVPAAKGQAPAIDLATIAEGAYARRVDAGVDFGLTVALPDGTGVAPEILAAAESAIKAVADDPAGAGLRAVFVPAGEPADLRLAILPPETIASASGEASLDHHVWLLPPTGDVVVVGSAKSPSIDLAGKSRDEAAEALADNLTRIARATNLLKLGASLAAAPLDVAVDLQMRSAEAPQFAGLDPASVPVLIPGDQVQLRLQNRMDAPVDMNVLYVGSDYSITHMYAGRIQPGDTFQKTALRITDGSFGRERMIVITTPAKPQSAVENLGFLAQKAVPQTRGGDGQGFRAALAEAGFGTRTRGAVAMVEPEGEPSGSITQFDFQIEPQRP